MSCKSVATRKLANTVLYAPVPYRFAGVYRQVSEKPVCRKLSCWELGLAEARFPRRGLLGSLMERGKGSFLLNRRSPAKIVHITHVAIPQLMPLCRWEKRGKREKHSMRFMLTFRVPMDEGNAGIKDGSLGQTLETIIDELKPEAAYFGPIEGARGGYLVVNFDDPSQLPAVAEPLFVGLGATIQIGPVFTPDELPTETLQQVAQKYG